MILSVQEKTVEVSDWRKNVEAMSGMEGRKKMFDAGASQWTDVGKETELAFIVLQIPSACKPKSVKQSTKHTSMQLRTSQDHIGDDSYLFCFIFAGINSMYAVSFSLLFC